MDETEDPEGVLETTKSDQDQVQKADRIWHTQAEDLGYGNTGRGYWKISRNPISLER